MGTSFYAHIENMNRSAEQYVKMNMQVSSIARDIFDIRKDLGMKGDIQTEFYLKLGKFAETLDIKGRDLSKLGKCLSSTAKVYSTNEKALMGKTSQKLKWSSGIAGGNVGKAGTTKKPFEWKWTDTLKIIGKFGFVGATINTIGSMIGTDWSKGGWVGPTKNIIDLIGKGAKAVDGGIKTDWAKSLFGIGKEWKNYFDARNWAKASKVSEKLGVVTKWAGDILTFVKNGYENYKEFSSMTGRAWGETIVEGIVDIGTVALAEAGVAAAWSAGAAALAAAGIISAPVSAPAVVIGAAGVGVTWAANGLCKWATGKFGGESKDLGEVVADTIFDVSEWVGKNVLQKSNISNISKAVGTGDLPNIAREQAGKAVSVVKETGKRVVSGVKSIASGLENIGTKWGSRVFA